jgi:hypothetical protein
MESVIPNGEGQYLAGIRYSAISDFVFTIYGTTRDIDVVVARDWPALAPLLDGLSLDPALRFDLGTPAKLAAIDALWRVGGAR